MRRAWFVLLIAGLAASMAAPAAAMTVKEPYQCEAHFLSFIAQGTAWIEDGALHMRGLGLVYDVVGDAQCAGDMSVVVNFNVDLTDWSGNLWGTATEELDAFDGGYNLAWNGHWTTSDPIAADATDIWAGQYVGQGFGQLEGWQARATLQEKTHILVLEEGYAFAPGGSGSDHGPGQ